MDWKLCSLVVLLFALPGCSIFETDERALLLETDRESYDLNAAEGITVTAENQSSSIIHYSTCMPTWLQELDGSRVVASLGFPVCECLCPAELAPGEKWSYSISLAWIRQNAERLELGKDHTFRLRLAFFRDEEMKVLLDEDVLYSNRFRLTM